MASLLLSPWRLRGLRIGARRGRWLAASIFLASRMASAQEALRNSLASQVTAQARRVQQESGLYTVKAGDFRLLVTPSLSIDWNDNVNVSKSNAEDDFILRPLLQLNASYPLTQYNLLNLSVGIGYDKYLSHDELSTWRLQSGSELSFDIFVKDFRINLHDQVQYLQDSAREAAVAGTAQYGTLNNTAGLAVIWDLKDVSLSLAYDHQNFISQATQFQYLDRASELILGRAGFRVNPRTTVGIEATSTFTRYDQSVLNNNSGYSVGAYAQWQPGAYFHVEPRAGYTVYHFQQTSRSIQTANLNSWYVDLNVTHQITDAIGYSIDGGHEIRLGIQSDSIEDSFFRPAINWRIVKDLGLQINFSYEHGKQGAGNRIGNLVETYDWWTSGLSVSYLLTQKLTLGVNYRLTLRSSDNSSRSYAQNLVGLQLTYQFK